MTLKDFMYLLFAIIVFYFSHWDLREDYELEKFIDRLFFLGERG